MGTDLRKSEIILGTLGCAPKKLSYFPTDASSGSIRRVKKHKGAISMRLKLVEEQAVTLMGASSGIGREAALRFAERGAEVVVSARSEPGLNSLVDEIRGKGGEATVVVADTSEYEQVKAVADRAVEEYGRPDTWVHLAAVGLFAPRTEKGRVGQ